MSQASPERPVDWRLAGQKADAKRVANILRERYESNAAKTAISAWVIRELRAAGPSLVADLWGGGRSADEMTAAGLSVLSIDDGRSFGEYGISKPRGRRAMELLGEQGGYRTAWGSAARNLSDCDAAWLDFMGHMSSETERTLRACQHMKALAITLMPERMEGVSRLSVETWRAMYRGAIESLTGLHIRLVSRYRRPGGHNVLVFVAVSRKNNRERRRERSREAMRAYRSRPEVVARELARRADPEYRERERERDRVRRADPEYRERELENDRVRHRERYARDPEYRERKLERKRERYARDPEYRERERERDRVRSRERYAAKYATDPDYRERERARSRERYAAKMAAYEKAA